MKKMIIIFAVALLAPQVIQAQGTIYLSNLGQTPDGSLAVGSDSWLGEGFRTGTNVDGYVLDSVQFSMMDASGNPSGFTAMIYSAIVNFAILPGSSLGTLNGSVDPATSGVYTYTPASSMALSPHTTYFIVLTAGTAIANGAYEWGLAGTYSYNPTDGWAVGNHQGTIGVFDSSLDGSSWNLGNQGNLQFAINATAIPEPSPSWLVLLGSGVFIYARRNHKSKARTVP